jgi:DNA-binding HxlR family transcriptional regulator
MDAALIGSRPNVSSPIAGPSPVAVANPTKPAVGEPAAKTANHESVLVTTTPMPQLAAETQVKTNGNTTTSRGESSHTNIQGRKLPLKKRVIPCTSEEESSTSNEQIPKQIKKKARKQKMDTGVGKANTTKSSEQPGTSDNKAGVNKAKKTPKANNNSTAPKREALAPKETNINARDQQQRGASTSNPETTKVVEKATPQKRSAEPDNNNNMMIDLTLTQSESAPTPKPKKKKRKKISFEGLILRTLFQSSCKPFNLKELTQAVDCASASALEFALMSLMDKKLVIKKEFPAKKEGREPKVLYWGNLDMQKHKDAIMTLGEPCSASFEEMANVESEHNGLLKKLQTMDQTARILQSQPSTVDVEETLTTLETDVTQLQTRIQNAKAFKLEMTKSKNKGGAINPTKLKKRINHHRDEWRKRKEKAVDFLDNLADAMEKKLKDVHTMLDIETDEMMGVKLPKKQDIS